MSRIDQIRIQATADIPLSELQSEKNKFWGTNATSLIQWYGTENVHAIEEESERVFNNGENVCPGKNVAVLWGSDGSTLFSRIPYTRRNNSVHYFGDAGQANSKNNTLIIVNLGDNLKFAGFKLDRFFNFANDIKLAEDRRYYIESSLSQIVAGTFLGNLDGPNGQLYCFSNCIIDPSSIGKAKIAMVSNQQNPSDPRTILMSYFSGAMSNLPKTADINTLNTTLLRAVARAGIDETRILLGNGKVTPQQIVDLTKGRCKEFTTEHVVTALEATPIDGTEHSCVNRIVQRLGITGKNPIDDVRSAIAKAITEASIGNDLDELSTTQRLSLIRILRNRCNALSFQAFQEDDVMIALGLIPSEPLGFYRGEISSLAKLYGNDRLMVIDGNGEILAQSSLIENDSWVSVLNGDTGSVDFSSIQYKGKARDGYRFHLTNIDPNERSIIVVKHMFGIHTDSIRTTGLPVDATQEAELDVGSTYIIQGKSPRVKQGGIYLGSIGEKENRKLCFTCGIFHPLHSKGLTITPGVEKVEAAAHEQDSAFYIETGEKLNRVYGRAAIRVIERGNHTLQIGRFVEAKKHVAVLNGEKPQLFYPSIIYQGSTGPEHFFDTNGRLSKSSDITTVMLIRLDTPLKYEDLHIRGRKIPLTSDTDLVPGNTYYVQANNIRNFGGVFLDKVTTESGETFLCFSTGILHLQSARSPKVIPEEVCKSSTKPQRPISSSSPTKDLADKLEVLTPFFDRDNIIIAEGNTLINEGANVEELDRVGVIDGKNGQVYFTSIQLQKDEHPQFHFGVSADRLITKDSRNAPLVIVKLENQIIANDYRVIGSPKELKSGFEPEVGVCYEIKINSTRLHLAGEYLGRIGDIYLFDSAIVRPQNVDGATVQEIELLDDENPEPSSLEIAKDDEHTLALAETPGSFIKSADSTPLQIVEEKRIPKQQLSDGAPPPLTGLLSSIASIEAATTIEATTTSIELPDPLVAPIIDKNDDGIIAALSPAGIYSLKDGHIESGQTYEIVDMNPANNDRWVVPMHDIRYSTKTDNKISKLEIRQSPPGDIFFATNNRSKRFPYGIQIRTRPSQTIDDGHDNPIYQRERKPKK